MSADCIATKNSLEELKALLDKLTRSRIRVKSDKLVRITSTLCGQVVISLKQLSEDRLSAGQAKTNFEVSDCRKTNLFSCNERCHSTY